MKCWRGNCDSQAMLWSLMAMESSWYPPPAPVTLPATHTRNCATTKTARRQLYEKLGMELDDTVK